MSSSKKIHTKKKWTGLLNLAKGSYYHLLRDQSYIGLVSWMKYLVKVKILRRIKTYESTQNPAVAISKNTISHNLKGLSLFNIQGFAGSRPELLFRQVSLIEQIDFPNAKLLIVGPRADSELMIAHGYGFKKKNTRGLDLISYSSRIDVGDMHKMPYEDNTWDVMILGWVIAYSDNPVLAAQEIVRVSKHNAIISLGVEYHPLSIEEIYQEVGYKPGSNKRIENTEEILSFFGESVNKVFFRQDIDESRKDKQGAVMVTFSINKQ